MNWMKPKSAQPSEQEVATAVREALAESHAADQVLDSHHGPEVVDGMFGGADDMGEDTPDRITGYAKLSQLVSDDFPFDESQTEAIEGLVAEEYGCLTGAAGTGKTTCTKKLVDRLQEELALSGVNMEEYWKQKYESEDAEDDYEAPEKWVPSVCLVSFTGRATQQIKKNFPRDWHGNVMTIHRCLGFYPEFYEDYDDESGEYKMKRRFVPTYTEDLRLPWDVIIIDEAGMLGLDLWHQLWAAAKAGCRIYMIGDINQLPPVHGKPIFGFALAKWPAWELTHVHRQQGKNNAIVDNAWRILNGRTPVSEGRFQMLELCDPKSKKPDDANMASRRVRALVPALQKKGVYDPIRDTIITPINGEESSRGYALGQLPLNREFAMIFNPQSENPRFIIDGGREHKQFAIGDKVMATKNDWDAGITNGMTGVIVDIAEHAGYSGNRNRFGRVEDVKAYMELEGDNEPHVDFNLDDLNDSFEAIDQGMKDKKEKRERGPASHIVTVRFGDAEHGFEIPFSTLSEVGSLMTAYVVTCHKMQGGEAPTIVVILHDAHKQMLYREWFYTAVTRASEKCIVFYTKDALRVALAKQNIKGSTLQEKVKAFMQLIDPKGMLGTAIKVNLPESTSGAARITEKRALVPAAQRHMLSAEEKEGGLSSLLAKAKARQEPAPAPAIAKVILETRERVVHHHHYHTTTVVVDREESNEQSQTVDGGELRTHAPAERGPARVGDSGDSLPALPAPESRLVPQWGAYRMLRDIESRQSVKLLTHQPPKKVNPWAAKLGVKK